MPSLTSTWGDSPQRSAFFERIHKMSALNEIQMLRIPSLRGIDVPVISLILLGCGSVLLVCANYLNYPPIGWVGTATLLSTLVAYPLERILKRLLVSRRLKDVRPMIQELHELREILGKYLSELDKRTSRYFHCVTNTKVSTYFMLRQIERAIEELYQELDSLRNRPTFSNFSAILASLRGDLVYRDGFEFSSGELHTTPVTKIVPKVLELTSNLEQGIQELEEEIEHYNHQVSPFLENR